MPRCTLPFQIFSSACLIVSAAALVAAPASAQSAGEQLDVPTYGAVRVTRAPTVDGRLDDEAWAFATWTSDFVDIRGEGFGPPGLTTRAKIVWDATGLYIGAELEEPHLWATLTRRDAIIYHDNDFEVFLDPDGDGEAYFELEINALGTEFDLFLDRPYVRGGSAHIEWDMLGLRSAVDLRGTLNNPTDRDDGWSVEIAIPWTDLVAPDSVNVTGQRAVTVPSVGDAWRVNFSRVEWPLVVADGAYARERVPRDWSDHPEHNWVWAPQGVINMHLPEYWGVVRFVNEEGGSR